MARKNKAPKAPKPPQAPAKPFDKETKSAFIAILLIILLFTCGHITGTFVSTRNSVGSPGTEADTTVLPMPQETAPQTTAPQTTAPAASSTQQADTTAPAATAPQATTLPVATTSAQAAVPTSVEEILKVYNDAANKVKTDATVVTRNFKRQQLVAEKTQLPPAVQSVATGLIDQFLKDNNEVQTYDTKELIIEKFPVSKETWTSKATPADIREATCTDDGTSYNITLKFVDGKNPQGTGVANAFSCLTKQSVTDAASFVQECSFEYYDAVITCKVDKASGRLTWANYHLPLTLSATAKVVVTVSGTVGMMFEEDYTITY